MKKVIGCVLVVLILFAKIPDVAALTLHFDGKEVEYNSPIMKIIVNGEEVSTQIPPVILDDRTYVPVGAIFKKAGAEVSWDPEFRKVTVQMKDKSIEMIIDQTLALVNGTLVEMEQPAKIINDWTMVPIRFVGETLGMEIGWHPEKGQVTLDNYAELKDVRVSRKDDTECITLNIDRLQAYNCFRLTDPDRIVIDMDNAVAPSYSGKFVVESTAVKGIRYSQSEDRKVRIVLDTYGQPEYRIEKGKDSLNVYLNSKGIKNVLYVNSQDCIRLVLDGIDLTDGEQLFRAIDRAASGKGGSSLVSGISRKYSEKYNQEEKSYTLTFSNEDVSFGSGVLYINDTTLDRIEFWEDQKSKTNNITFYAKGDYKYNVAGHSNENETVVSIIKPVNASDRLVVIGAGHGGSEPGAIAEGIYEKDINLDVAKRLNDLLKAKGINTFMLREDDRFVGLYERINIVNALNAELYISVHHNSSTLPEVGGTMVVYNPGRVNPNGFSSKRLAEIVSDKLVNALGTERLYNKGDNSFVDTKALIPSVISEAAFLSNDEERAKLLDPEFRQKEAEALCDAILQALDENKPVTKATVAQSSNVAMADVSQ